MENGKFNDVYNQRFVVDGKRKINDIKLIFRMMKAKFNLKMTSSENEQINIPNSDK